MSEPRTSKLGQLREVPRAAMSGRSVREALVSGKVFPGAAMSGRAVQEALVSGAKMSGTKVSG